MSGILDHLNVLIFNEAKGLSVDALIKPLENVLSRIPRKKKIRIEPTTAVIRFKEGYLYAVDIPSEPKPPYTPILGYAFNKRNAYILIPFNITKIYPDVIDAIPHDVGHTVALDMEDGWRIPFLATKLDRSNVQLYVKAIPRILAAVQKRAREYKKAVQSASGSLAGLRGAYENIKKLVEERLRVRGMNSLAVHGGEQTQPKSSIFWVIVTPASIKKVSSPYLKGVARIVTKVLSDRVETSVSSMSYGSSYLLFNLGLLKNRGKKLPASIEGIKDIRREDKELYVITWDSVDSAEKNLEKLVKALLV